MHKQSSSETKWPQRDKSLLSVIDESNCNTDSDCELVCLISYSYKLATITTTISELQPRRGGYKILLHAFDADWRN